MAFHHLALATNDMAATHRFYTEAMGFELVKAVVAPTPTRGWAKLYADHVQQAHLGADLDILVGGSGADVPRDSH
jgi:catechol 2,3-dioxygenase-like lactoylglutathione lyase family enzyme